MYKHEKESVDPSLSATLIISQDYGSILTCELMLWVGAFCVHACLRAGMGLALHTVPLITSPNGEYISIQARIEDIETRYGKDSIQAKDAKKLVKMIGHV